jgi:hypothetical protein
MRLDPRKCDCCRRDYTPPRIFSRFCSRSCWAKTSNKERMKPNITMECEWCKSIFEKRPGSKKRFCGYSCSNSYTNEYCDKEAKGAAISTSKRGKTHRGAPHSEKTKKILSEKTGKRMRDPLRNPFIGKIRSEESREKQSHTRSQRFVDGIYRWKMLTKSSYVDSKKGGYVFCRSSWETKAVHILDNDITVVSFKVEPFTIPYLLNKKLRHYVPDFLIEHIDGRKIIVEVKPACYVNAPINVTKFSAAREYCSQKGFEFEVWSQDRLGISR